MGGDATAKLQTALEQALKDDIDPITWSPDEVRKILGAESLSEEAAGALGQMLCGIFQQLDALEIPEFETKVTVNPQIEALTQIDPAALAAELGIPEEQAATVLEKITGVPSFENAIQVLASNFGIPPEDAHDILWRLTGTPDYTKMKEPDPVSDFGLPKVLTHTIDVVINAVQTGINWIGDTASTIGGKISTFFNGKALGGVVGGDTIPGYASGGLTSSFGARLITVGEEGPEMIIPLSSQRRNRALKLWAMAGHMMDIPGFAQGGVTDNSSQDEGYRLRAAPENKAPASAPSGSAQVNVGGISVQISVDASGGQNVAEAIQEQGAEIAETVAGILADALQVQFENTPTLGGA